MIIDQKTSPEMAKLIQMFQSNIEVTRDQIAEGVYRLSDSDSIINRERKISNALKLVSRARGKGFPIVSLERKYIWNEDLFNEYYKRRSNRGGNRRRERASQQGAS